MSLYLEITGLSVDKNKFEKKILVFKKLFHKKSPH
jgi:hypothetical protein